MQVKVAPRTAKVGQPYLISGSGFEGFHVQINVTYGHRSETYKAAVAQALAARHPDGAMVPNPTFDAGDISLTQYAEEAGTVAVVVRDSTQRVILAETTFEVRRG